MAGIKARLSCWRVMCEIRNIFLRFIFLVLNIPDVARYQIKIRLMITLQFQTENLILTFEPENRIKVQIRINSEAFLYVSLSIVAFWGCTVPSTSYIRN